MGPSDIVLAAAAELALATGTRMLEPLALEGACTRRGMDHEEWFSALLGLRRAGLVALQVADPGGLRDPNAATVVLLAMTNAGLQRHLRNTRPDLAQVAERLAAAVSDNAGRGPVDLPAEIGEPALLVECLLDGWVDEGRLVYSKAPRRRFRVHRVLGPLPPLPGPAAPTSETASG